MILLQRLAQTFELASDGTIENLVADFDDQTAENGGVNLEGNFLHRDALLHGILFLAGERKCACDHSRITGKALCQNHFVTLHAREEFIDQSVLLLLVQGSRSCHGRS